MKYVNKENIIISGFPISMEELNEIIERLNTVSFKLFFIHLLVDENQIVKRFFNRAICPICSFPGEYGKTCVDHKIDLMQRNDCTEDDLKMRFSLYYNRIVPFLNCIENNFKYLFLNINSNELTRDMLYLKVIDFLKRGGL